MRVLKYQVPFEDHPVISIPAGGQILQFRFQKNEAWIWVLVDPAQDYQERVFRLSGTGHRIHIPLERLSYIGTAPGKGGIYHLFEVT